MSSSSSSSIATTTLYPLSCPLKHKHKHKQSLLRLPSSSSTTWIQRSNSFFAESHSVAAAALSLSVSSRNMEDHQERLLSWGKLPPLQCRTNLSLQFPDAVAPRTLVVTPFGYTRKDVLLIGVGLTVVGIGLKSGLEYVGVDPLQAGNVVQLVLVLGLTVGWISTYIFRVSNKEMTYAQQLRDYEDKVMEKRLESLTEAEIEALLEQVEEEKRRLAGGEQQLK
ncbi:hypothetical protein BUALT_Bualt07G0083400 [Buddleja alternifolia]|uniref:Transmembrane protein n=1 Tax=Buddleja alternifolia TaxID=168488 RepID=A0AAV6XJW8_9LAMI|nr:hypothetical protein BUALT_Bualt07G0083400 [Buddleja alternifolia]